MEIMIKKLMQEVFLLKQQLIALAQGSGGGNLPDLRNLDGDLGNSIDVDGINDDLKHQSSTEMSTTAVSNHDERLGIPK